MEYRDRAMPSFSDSGSQPILRLSTLQKVPSSDELDTALRLAQRNSGKVIELPWAGYALQVTCQSTAEAPFWSLFGDDETLLWTQEGSDLQLIQTLIEAACGPNDANKSIPPPGESEALQAIAAALQGKPTMPAPGWGSMSSDAEPESPVSQAAQYLEQHSVQASTGPITPFAFHLPAGQAQQSATIPPGAQVFGVSTSFSAPKREQTADQSKKQQSDGQMQTKGDAKAHSDAPPNTMAPQPWPAPSDIVSPPATPPDADLSGTQFKTMPMPVELDRAAVDSVFRTFTDQETGFITQASFLFFLVNEYSRFQRGGKPFSVIRFELLLGVGEQSPAALTAPAMREAGKRIFAAMRSLDWVSHWSDSDYALLLPHTTRDEAKEVAGAVVASLTDGALLPDWQPDSLRIFMGLASMPEDCNHPGILLAAAQEAKTQARKKGVPLLLFADVK